MIRKVINLSLFFLILFSSMGVASAWERHSHWRPHFHIGFQIILPPPPPILLYPPVVIYREYSPSYYYDGPRYYREGYREWVPGHWEERWTPYGWERIWVPGHWRYWRY
ncbi:MAG: hypothetical protein ACUVTN_10015 [Thermodesulfobacteriota bacterium]